MQSNQNDPATSAAFRVVGSLAKSVPAWFIAILGPLTLVVWIGNALFGQLLAKVWPKDVVADIGFALLSFLVAQLAVVVWHELRDIRSSLTTTFPVKYLADQSAIHMTARNMLHESEQKAFYGTDFRL